MINCCKASDLPDNDQHYYWTTIKWDDPDGTSRGPCCGTQGTRRTGPTSDHALQRRTALRTRPRRSEGTLGQEQGRDPGAHLGHAPPRHEEGEAHPGDPSGARRTARARSARELCAGDRQGGRV